LQGYQEEVSLQNTHNVYTGSGQKEVYIEAAAMEAVIGRHNTLEALAMGLGTEDGGRPLGTREGIKRRVRGASGRARGDTEQDDLPTHRERGSAAASVLSIVHSSLLGEDAGRDRDGIG